MVWILFIAVIALAALVVRRGGGAPTDPRALDDVRQEARRRVENLADELRAELAVQRRLIAELAAGATLTREQVEEGRLWKDVDPREAERLLAEARVHVLDVRTPNETAQGVLPGAQLIPVDQLEERIAELPRDDRPTLVYCAAGGRSAAACEFLESKGRRALLNLTGGFSAWQGPRAMPGGRS
jgi:rhodanese-related sulfurtransferase